METKIISTDKAPAAIGPYSQAVAVGALIYTSGMIPVDPDTGHMVSGIREQTRQALTNVKSLLEAAGSSMNKVIKTTVFIKDMNHFAAVNEVYATFFDSDPPARSCVEVSRLPKDVLIEVEAVAVK
ncbi:MAG: RidA family protein [Lachnospiraceae bacterium]|nr:RidA family protein [Lachnospiraceae bacterium]